LNRRPLTYHASALPTELRGQGRGDWIRTSDLLNPIQVRYRAALRPEKWCRVSGVNVFERF
jgi:hypothetical protein